MKCRWSFLKRCFHKLVFKIQKKTYFALSLPFNLMHDQLHYVNENPTLGHLIPIAAIIQIIYAVSI